MSRPFMFGPNQKDDTWLRIPYDMLFYKADTGVPMQSIVKDLYVSVYPQALVIDFLKWRIKCGKKGVASISFITVIDSKTDKMTVFYSSHSGFMGGDVNSLPVLHMTMGDVFPTDKTLRIAEKLSEERK